MFKKLGKPLRFFDISNLPNEVREISKDELIFEEGLEKYKDII